MPVVRLRLPRATSRGSPQVFVRSRLRRARLVQAEVRRLAQRILTQVAPRTGTGTRLSQRRRREPVPCELSLDFVGDRRMRRLNREYRGRDLPTDVLAFSPSPFPLPPSRGERTKVRGAANVLQRGNPPALLGDVVISLHTAARHAAADGRAVDHEVATLLIHGILHLVGYDHERGEREARRMRRKERAILRSLIPIPKLIAGSK